MAALAGHEHHLGQGESESRRLQRLLLRPYFRREGRGCLAPARGGWSPRRTHWGRQADEDHLRPAAEHLWRASAVDGLCLVSGRRSSGVHALHGRLLLLHGRRIATRTINVALQLLFGDLVAQNLT